MNYSQKLLLILSTLIFLYFQTSDQQLVQTDDLCPRLSPVLCVRDTLLAIASTTKNLNRTLNQIDDEIEEKVQIIETLNRYVQFELSLIHFRLPTPQFHMQFIQLNNVDQVKSKRNVFLFSRCSKRRKTFRFVF